MSQKPSHIAKLESQRKSEYFLKSKFHGKKVSDWALVCMELYNPNKFDVIVEIDRTKLAYIRQNGITDTPHKAILKADSFLFLPHRFYLLTGVGIPKGEQISLIVNQGDTMFIGNKYQSRPE